MDMEKLEWMKEMGIKEFESPMKYHLNGRWLLSEEFIEQTPLEKLKELCEKSCNVQIEDGLKTDKDV